MYRLLHTYGQPHPPNYEETAPLWAPKLIVTQPPEFAMRDNDNSSNYTLHDQNSPLAASSGDLSGCAEWEADPPEQCGRADAVLGGCISTGKVETGSKQKHQEENFIPSVEYASLWLDFPYTVLSPAFEIWLLYQHPQLKQNFCSIIQRLSNVWAAGLLSGDPRFDTEVLDPEPDWVSHPGLCA